LLLQPGENCWRVETADRLSVLMENATYFETLLEVLPRARKSILLLGWQFDPRTRLNPEGRRHDQVCEVGLLLRRLVRENPALDVRLLIWRSPLPIAWSQDFFPLRARAWFRRQPIDFRLDRARPIGACHHQKVVVIDDAVAFCGGGDISVDRWDTALHLDDEPLRRTPTGLPYPPRHEVMTVMDGAAARALADLARERWFEAAGERLAPCVADEDPWPKTLEPDLRGVRVGIARTRPAWRGDPGVRECERLHLDAIAGARRLIYLENQYVTSPVIAAALAESLERPEGPEVMIVSTGKSPSWFDQASMDGARRALLQRLRTADRHGRFSAWMPLTSRGQKIIVHSKMTIVDDRLLRVGSANLNNRSGGFDTECDVVVETEEGTAAASVIARRRARSLAHFLAVDPETFEYAFAETGGLRATVEALNHAGRMAPLAPEGATGLSKWIARWQLGDPSSPQDSWRPWRRGRLSRRLKQVVAHAADTADAAPAADAISKSTINGR
jgi:phosphatidylserine/phosphatidylglycerophosphate/cardiolipin synthase-like enzyme